MTLKEKDLPYFRTEECEPLINIVNGFLKNRRVNIKFISNCRTGNQFRISNAQDIK